MPSRIIFCPPRSRIYFTFTPPEIIRDAAHVLSAVIISFKCGAFANPSISARGP